MAQNKLRTKLLGSNVWDRLMKERQRNKEYYSLEKLHNMMIKCKKYRRKPPPEPEVIYAGKAKKKLRPKDGRNALFLVYFIVLDDALSLKPKPKFNIDIENLPRNGSLGTPKTERPSTYREEEMSLPTEANTTGRRASKVTARRYSAPQVMPY